MAKIVIACPNCSSRWLIDESHLGSRGQCRKCHAAFVLTRPDEQATQTISSGPKTERDSAEPTEVTLRQGDPGGLWQVGDVILDVYEVKPFGMPGYEGKHYGEGGMGVVYRVRHRGWDMDLAVKSPKPRNVATERGKRSFERECETWVGLGLHPNIVSCYYVRRIDGIPRIFAEFMEGGTLSDWMKDGRLYQGGPSVAMERILDIAIQVAWGLDHAHQHGVIHQDMKPGNVMLLGQLAKVTDFGLARAWHGAGQMDLSPEQMGMAVSLGGITPAYCSPEQLEAAVQAEVDIPEAERTKITRQTDIWSWGLTVFAMFAGKSPCRFGGQTAPQTLKNFLEQPPEGDLLPAMPPPVAELLGRCFQVAAERRPASMTEVAGELQRIYQQVTGKPYPRRQPVSTELMANSLNNRAASLLDLGKRQEAAQALEEAWRRHPWLPQVTYNRGLLAWRTAQITDVELVTQLEELVKMRPQQWTAAYALGLVQLERGEVRAAVTALRRAVQLGGGDEVRSALQYARARLDRAPGCLRAFTGQPPHLTTVFVSSNGLCALSGMDDRTYQLWEPATGRSLLTIDRPESDPTTTPDGRWQLAPAGPGALTLTDARSGRPATAFGEIRWGLSPQKGAASRDGRWKLTQGPHYAFEIREMPEGNLLRSFRGHTARVNSVSFSPDARWALSGGKDKTVRLWEVPTGRCLRTLKGHADSVTGVFLGGSGLWGLSECSGRRLHLWNLALLTSESERFQAPILICDVTSAETAGQTHQKFLDLVQQAQADLAARRCEEALQQVRAARQLPGYAVTEEVLDLWNAVGGHCLRTGCRDAWCVQLLEGHADEVRAVAMSGDGRWILSASHDMTLRLWETESGRHLRTLAGHADWVRSVAFGPDGRWALSASYDKTLRLWDLDQGTTVRQFPGHGHHIPCVAVTADGRLACSGSWDRSVRVWDVATARCLKTLRGHGNYVGSVAPSLDGRLLLSGCDDHTVRVWDTAAGEVLHSLEGHTDWVPSVALSADARLAASASKDRTVRVWDVQGGECLRVLQGHLGPVWSVALSGDGRWVLSGGGDHTVRLWEVETGRCHHVFEGHTGAVYCVFLSPDGRWALSAGQDKVVRLWEIDWEFQFPGWSDWDDRARPHLETFLTLCCPVAEDGITRHGRPTSTDADFRRLLDRLEAWGLGWIRPEGIRAQLEEMSAQWQGPPPVNPDQSP